MSLARLMRRASQHGNGKFRNAGVLLTNDGTNESY